MIREIRFARGGDHLLIMGDDGACYTVDCGRRSEIGTLQAHLAPHPEPITGLVNDTPIERSDDCLGITGFAQDGDSGFTGWTDHHPATINLTAEELATIVWAMDRFVPI